MDEDLNLQFELTGDSSSLQAALKESLDAITAYEDKISGMLDTISFGALTESVSSLDSELASIASRASSVSTALSTINSSGLSSATSMSTGLETTLASVDTRLAEISSSFGEVSAAFDPITGKMQAMDDFIEAEGRWIDTNADVSEAFRRIAEAADEAAAAVNSENQSFQNSDKALEEHAKGVDKATKSENKKTKQSSQLTNQLLKEINAFLKSGNAGNKAANMLGRAFKLLTGITLGKWLADAAFEAIRFTENMNLYAVAVGNAVEETDKFIEKAAEMYGMSYSGLYRAIGTFANLGTTLDLSTTAAAHLSTGLTKLSIDLSSFFDLEPEQVYENMASGLQGMSRAVRKYGMDIRSVTLQQTALSLGLTENVSDMSEVNRVILRYITMLRQATNATGEFAKSIERPANQLRVFKEQMIEFGRAVGNFLIVPLASALPYINGVVMALKEILFLLAALVGIKAPEISDFATDAADSMDSLGASIADTTKKMKSMLAPFDEINNIQEQTSDEGLDLGGVVDPKLLEALMNTSTSFEDIRMKALDVRDELLDFLGFNWDLEGKLHFDASELEKNLIAKFPQWTKTITAIFANWEDIVAGFKAVWGALGRVFDTVREKLNKFIAAKVDPALATFIENLGGNLQNLADWIDRNNELLANFIIVLGSLIIIQKITSWLLPLLTGLGTLATLIGAIGAGPLLIIVATLAAIITSMDTIDFTPLEESLSNLGASIGNTFGAISDTWQWLLDNVLVPLGTWVIEDALPESINLVATAFDFLLAIAKEISPILSWIWENVLAPMAEWTGGAIVSILKGIGDALKWIMSNEIAVTIVKSLAIAIGLVNTALTIYNVVQAIATGLAGGFAAVIAFITSPVTIAIAAITAIIAVIILLVKNWETVSEVTRNVWNGIVDFLEPLISWFKNTFIAPIAGAIDGLITAFTGLIDFVAGIFTGDWKRALSGLANIFVGLGNAIISSFEGGLNFAIWLVNSFVSVVYKAIQGLVNGILGAISWIADFLGITFEVKWEGEPPQIPSLSVPRIPTVALAEGGIVKRATTALIGESGPEAVLPLNNTSWMIDLANLIGAAVASAIAQSTSQLGATQPGAVYLDGRQVGDIVYEHLESEARRRGQPLPIFEV